MIVDLDFVGKKFKEFNDVIFDGKLPLPSFKLTRASTFRGKLVYHIRRNFNKIINEDFEIRISTNFDLPEKEWEDVVIHEMIHLHIAHAGIKDTSAHGPIFRKIMHDINGNYGRNIRVSAKARSISELPQNIRKKAHYICLARFSDGHLGVAPVAKTRIFILWDLFQKFPGVRSLKWIGSTDIWFNKLPRVLKPKFYIIRAEDIIPHLKGGRILERRGNRIKVLNRRCFPDELLP